MGARARVCIYTHKYKGYFWHSQLWDWDSGEVLFGVVIEAEGKGEGRVPYPLV